jgi:hypothetical protein
MVLTAVCLLPWAGWTFRCAMGSLVVICAYHWGLRTLASIDTGSTFWIMPPLPSSFLQRCTGEADLVELGLRKCTAVEGDGDPRDPRRPGVDRPGWRFCGPWLNDGFSCWSGERPYCLIILGSRTWPMRPRRCSRSLKSWSGSGVWSLLGPLLRLNARWRCSRWTFSIIW